MTTENKKGRLNKRKRKERKERKGKKMWWHFSEQR